MTLDPTPAALAPLCGSRQSGETEEAIQACNDWLRLGVGRSLPGLLAEYNQMPPNTAPTLSLHTLERWSARFGWKARKAEYDAQVTEREKQALEEAKQARRRQIMAEGLAAAHERVIRLARLADFLEGQIFTEGQDDDGNTIYPNVWVPDVKSFGGGPFAERVDIQRFNGSLIGQYRATLADLAAEVGGRSRQPEADASEELPVKVYQNVDLSRV